MSAEASNWARRMRTGSPSTKALLLVLADIADNSGFIRFISSDYLSECCEMSRTRIFANLQTLTRAGVLKRDRSGVRDDGSPTVSGQLMLGHSFCLPEIRTAEGASSGAAEGQDLGSNRGGSVPLAGLRVSPASGTEGGDSVPPAGLRVSPVSGTESPPPPYSINNTISNNTTTTTILLEAEREELADSPAAEPEGVAEEGDAFGFSGFVKTYPFDPTMDVASARKLFEGLGERDRRLAVEAARRYAGALKARGRSHALDAVRWLRERRFADVAAMDAPKAVRPMIFVARGTEAWKAWVERGGHKPGLVTGERGGPRTGWHFPTLFPQGGAKSEAATVTHSDERSGSRK